MSQNEVLAFECRYFSQLGCCNPGYRNFAKRSQDTNNCAPFAEWDKKKKVDILFTSLELPSGT